MLTLSVLVPAYNEEKTIRRILEAVAAQSVPGVTIEVVVIDDASTDGTGRALDACPELYAQRITFPKNRGKGAAVIAGLAAAGGEYVLVQDADLEYSPKDFATLLRPVLDFQAEIVIGSRFLAPTWTRVGYFWHKFGNRLITLMFNVCNNTTFTDIYTGYVLFRRTLLDGVALKCERWDQQAEILSYICPRARAIYEVPITYAGRTYEEGKKIRATDVIPVIWTMLRLRLARLLA